MDFIILVVELKMLQCRERDDFFARLLGCCWEVINIQLHYLQVLPGFLHTLQCC